MFRSVARGPVIPDRNLHEPDQRTNSSIQTPSVKNRPSPFDNPAFIQYY
jgi:hypothetical protein